MEGARKFRAAIVCERARFAYTLHVLLECVKGVDFGADGGDVYVAGARVNEDCYVPVLSEGLFWVGAMQVDIDAVESRRCAGSIVELRR